MKPFYQVMQNEKSADVYIFGDICGWAFEELGEQSAVTLTDKIKNLDDEYKELKEKNKQEKSAFCPLYLPQSRLYSFRKK